jgi:hypothetical protein
MYQHEITWTQTLYPQYQVYEHRLNTFNDRLWPISLHQNEVTLAKAGLFYSGNGDIVICAFCGIHLYRWPISWIIHENYKCMLQSISLYKINFFKL